MTKSHFINVQFIITIIICVNNINNINNETNDNSTILIKNKITIILMKTNTK